MTNQPTTTSTLILYQTKGGRAHIGCQSEVG